MPAGEAAVQWGLAGSPVHNCESSDLAHAGAVCRYSGGIQAGIKLIPVYLWVQCWPPAKTFVILQPHPGPLWC